MPFSSLQRSERKVHSQNGEDGVLEAIFARLGTTNKYFVEFGCGDGTECNSAFLLEQGWRGLMMDSAGVSNNPRATIHAEFITAENINALFQKYGVPPQFDLLSIDIDGNDFWVWREIAARPRVVVIEYNSHVPPDVCSAIVYDPAFQSNGTDYFGASLLALELLGREKGYTLIHCERAGVNAFFVAHEALPHGFQSSPIARLYRPPNYNYQGMRLRPDPARTMIDPFNEFNQWFSQIDCFGP
ncbi:MAG: hypothetical protein AB7O59_02340 [Pirellulales bacterium]